MAETPIAKKPKFLTVFGITLGATLVLALLYTLITGMSQQHLADNLCVGSLLLGVASIFHLFLQKRYLRTTCKRANSHRIIHGISQF